MKKDKKCISCLKGSFLETFNQVLCHQKGIVSPDFSCFYFKKLPDSLSCGEDIRFCSDCNNYEVDLSSSESFGLCKLFSVRKFNGALRTGCSKFEPMNFEGSAQLI